MIKFDKYLKHIKKHIKIYFLVGIFIWGYSRNIRIHYSNKTTMGYCYKKGAMRNGATYHYYFFVDGVKYTGSTRRFHEIGDSMQIRYYPPDPDVNFPEEVYRDLW